MDTPVVPVNISDRARAIYEYGLYLGNDPTHFSVIGDCQNVSSYFMSAFDTPGEYGLGQNIPISNRRLIISRGRSRARALQ